MSSSIGDNIKITIFGESHGEAIGVILENIPAGEFIDMDMLNNFLQRRAPGKSKYTTKRKEKDMPIFLSGIKDNFTTGSPISAIIKNSDMRSKDYTNLENTFRPSHADFTSYYKYNNFNDKRGGGHFSGRLTAPLCIAGGIIIQILERKNIYIGAHLLQIGNIKDKKFDDVNLSIDELRAPLSNNLPVLSLDSQFKMQTLLDEVSKANDSIGASIECAVLNIPIGIGNPMFDGIENKISQYIFGIPGVKGIQFGTGFDGVNLLGSQNNDPYYYDKNNIKLKSNNSGGILGGISTGMPIIFNIAMKPTPSISKVQQSVDINKGENIELSIKGRHDPCIGIRAVPVVESATAIAIYDMLMN